MMPRLIRPLLLVGLVVGCAWAQNSKPLSPYRILVVEAFSVERNAATEEFPRGHEGGIQEATVDRFKKEALFPSVLDGVRLPTDYKPENGTLILSGTVIFYDKGSRAARFWIGMGAGAAKVRVRFSFRDATTGQEVASVTRQGKFYGVWSPFGGNKQNAASEASGDVIDGLVKEIRKKR